MEYVVGVIVGGVVLWLLVKWIAFSSFKSQLMNAFGAKGIEYETADVIYATYAKAINSLHKDGMSAAAIVELVTGEMLGSAGSVTATSTSISKYQKVTEFVAGLLTGQAVLVSGSNVIDTNEVDDWFLGYIHGHYDAALQSSGLDLDNASLKGFLDLFVILFGEDRGRELFLRYETLQSAQGPDFMNGIGAGGQDLQDFISGKSNGPTSWAMRYHDNRKQPDEQDK